MRPSQAKSEAAKERGNMAFQASDFPAAVTHYSMAIRLDKRNHVLWSNRSAAHAGAGRYDLALTDAERCVQLAPAWGKGHARKGAALVGLGQCAEGVKAYAAGTSKQASDASLVPAW